MKIQYGCETLEAVRARAAVLDLEVCLTKDHRQLLAELTAEVATGKAQNLLVGDSLYLWTGRAWRLLGCSGLGGPNRGAVYMLRLAGAVLA